MNSRTEASSLPDWGLILQSVVEEIESERQGENGLFKRQLNDHFGCPVFGGMRLPGFLPCLIYRLPLETLRHREFRMSTRGFQVETEKSAAEDQFCDVEIRLNDESFREHFVLMATDLLSATVMASSAAEAGDLLLVRLRMWRDFSATLDGAGLGLDKLVGLAAELIFLRTLLCADISPSVAIQSWVGPSGHQHDFRLPKASVEVKSCRTVEAIKVTFSSTRQLEPVDDLPLFLAVVRIDMREPFGTCLPDLVREIRDVLRAGNHKSEIGIFNMKLIRVGYNEGAEAYYSRIRFRADDPIFFPVRDDFPRIASDAVPNEIDKIQFRLSIPSSLSKATPDWQSFAADPEESK